MTCEGCSVGNAKFGVGRMNGVGQFTCVSCGLPSAKLNGTATPDRIDEIKAERQKVYGDPRENHKGIAQMWACLLQPHAEAIAKMEPLPEHVVAMMMAALKLNRMRRVFHQDNYDDLTAYLSFAREWQKDHDSKTN